MRNVFVQLRRGALAFGLSLAQLPGASASTLVVSSDDWVFAGSRGQGTGTFVRNLVNEFGRRIHFHSSVGRLVGGGLPVLMRGAGAIYTAGTTRPFTLPYLRQLDAIFLGANYLSPIEKSVLTQYFEGGGNVFIMAGTNYGGAQVEAEAWNDFLAPYDIQLAPRYTSYRGYVTPMGDPLFDGVTGLLMLNPSRMFGNVVCCLEENAFSIVRLPDGPTPDDPRPGPTPQVPVPAAGLLLASGLGLVAAGGLRRRRRGRAAPLTRARGHAGLARRARLVYRTHVETAGQP